MPNFIDLINAGVNKTAQREDIFNVRRRQLGRRLKTTTPLVLGLLWSGVSLPYFFLDIVSETVPRDYLVFMVLKLLQSSLLQKEQNLGECDGKMPGVLHASKGNNEHACLIRLYTSTSAEVTP